MQIRSKKSARLLATAIYYALQPSTGRPNSTHKAHQGSTNAQQGSSPKTGSSSSFTGLPTDGGLTLADVEVALDGKAGVSNGRTDQTAAQAWRLLARGSF